MNFTSTVMQLLQNALYAADLRQQVYANNIANAETPGYKRLDVSFEAQLQAALTAPGGAPMASGASMGLGPGANWEVAAAVRPALVQVTDTSVDNNGNNVDLDAEMAALAVNQIRYNALVQALRSDFDRLHTAIVGG